MSASRARTRTLHAFLAAVAWLLLCIAIAGPAQAGLGLHGSIVPSCGGAPAADGYGGQICGGNFNDTTWQATAIQNGASSNLANLNAGWRLPGVYPGYTLGYNPATVIPASTYCAIHTTQCTYSATGGGGGGLAPVVAFANDGSHFLTNATVDGIDFTEGGTTCDQVIFGGNTTGTLVVNNFRHGDSDACSSTNDDQHLIQFTFNTALTQVTFSNYYIDGNPAGLCTTCITHPIKDVVNSNARGVNFIFKYGATINLPNRFANLYMDSWKLQYVYDRDFSLGTDYSNAGVPGQEDHGEYIFVNYPTGTTGWTQVESYVEHTLTTAQTTAGGQTSVDFFTIGTADATIQITPSVDHAFYIINPNATGGRVAGYVAWFTAAQYFPSASYSNVYIYPAGASACTLGSGSSPGITAPTATNIIDLYDMSSLPAYDVTPCPGHHP